jgi:hypothetical protein
VTTVGPSTHENMVKVTLNDRNEGFAAALIARYGADRLFVEYGVVIGFPEVH